MATRRGKKKAEDGHAREALAQNNLYSLEVRSHCEYIIEENNDLRRRSAYSSSMESRPARSAGVSPFCLELYPQSSSSVMSGRMAGSSPASLFSVAAFCGAKKYNPCLQNVLLLYAGTVKTPRQFQMLSCNAAQGKDLPKVQHGL